MPAFDAIVIGTGQTGPSLARRLVAAGRKVAVIERKLFGGTCVNTACTPTETLVASAYAAHVARRYADYGVVDKETRPFLGASFLGLNGDEVSHTVLNQMYAKAPSTVMARAMHIHPTVAELLPTMLRELRDLE
jgi:pyruvate/2-oxoglutarate dehydrogenase complex dihydrolipoamide dehydrogenase (E3) component